jgi:hypothetical protein
MGLDLIKTYGFQPGQFDILFNIFKKEGRMPPLREIQERAGQKEPVKQEKPAIKKENEKPAKEYASFDEDLNDFLTDINNS